VSWVRGLHGSWVADRRTRVLAAHLAALLPPDASSVLDVGCGDGRVTRMVTRERPELRVQGIEVTLRPEAQIPVSRFDGRVIPFGDAEFDAVLLVDVLHHTDDPAEVLREAARVAARAVVVKDHLLRGAFARATLRFMDHAGNPEEGVAFPYNYWSAERWQEAFDELGLRVEECRGRLGLYPPPADWIFGRSLHFAARLVRA
jgi:SAM-dependent methyltransferase